MAKELPKLKAETIARRKNEIRARMQELERELQALRREIDYGFRDRCPHPKNYVHHYWGQYERSRLECDLCGKELT